MRKNLRPKENKISKPKKTKKKKWEKPSMRVEDVEIEDYWGARSIPIEI